MKKLFLAITLSASIALGGCGTVGTTLTDVLSIGTASIANPVTRVRLNQTENVIKVAFAALNVWKQSCIKGLIPVTCEQQIAEVQVYTRQIPPYLAQLRTFVKNNDQVNATIVFNNLMGIYNTVKLQASAAGVSLGS